MKKVPIHIWRRAAYMRMDVSERERDGWGVCVCVEKKKKSRKEKHQNELKKWEKGEQQKSNRAFGIRHTHS